MVSKKSKRFNILTSPWTTIGVSFLLISVVLFQAIMNYNREKNFMAQLLSEKGAALIRSFEAGAKTGMMGMMGNQANLQTLLEATASQPGISYIFIIAKTGEVLAHNNRKMIGTTLNNLEFMKSTPDMEKPLWRIVSKENDDSYFEVYKAFLPDINSSGLFSMSPTMKGIMSQRNIAKWCSPGWMTDLPTNKIIDPQNRPTIFIGMNVAPFKEAISEDIRNSGIMILVIFLLGMAGVVSLFWARNYTQSRKLLHDTRAFASETLGNLPMGIVVVNEKSNINYINDAACYLLRINVSEINIIFAKELLPKEVWRLQEDVNSKNAVIEKELVLKTIENKSAPVNVSVTDIISEDGDFIGFVFILKDLSEIRSLEIEIRHKERLAAIGTLASGIAHEVRNPLSSIKGYATFFASIFEHNSENNKAANIMAEEVDRVDRVISELLEFARPADLKFKYIKIDEFIRNSLRVIKHEAELAKVKIIDKIEPNLSELKIDPDRFTQVLLNLYLNAIQAMKNGGKLTIEVISNHDSMNFKITDTGQGISPDDRINIFNPYYTTKKMGTGLGLAIAYKIIEGHKGSITVESDTGIGTTFIISIPFSNKEGN